MKMYLIVYSKATDYDIIGRIKQAGIRCYTKLEEVRGEGTETEPKLGTHTWPGGNNVLFVGVTDHEVSVISDLLREMKHSHPRAGIRGFILPLEEII